MLIAPLSAVPLMVSVPPRRVVVSAGHQRSSSRSTARRKRGFIVNLLGLKRISGRGRGPRRQKSRRALPAARLLQGGLECRLSFEQGEHHRVLLLQLQGV